MKKITSIGVGAVLVASSLTGAMAADLADLPEPFVKDGVQDFEFVIGRNAATADVVGAIEIAAAMQAANTVEVSTGSGASETTVEGGYKVGTTSNPLLLNGGLTVGRSVLRSEDIPSLLADGEVDVDTTSVDYEQSLELNGNVNVTYDTIDREPLLYLNLDETGKPLWTYTVNFLGSNFNISNADSGETLSLLGKAFTIGPAADQSGQYVTLYGSDETLSLGLREPQTVEVNGQSYEIEIVGANDNNPASITLSVNGQQKTLEAEDSDDIAGLDVFVQDLFVNTIPELTASANIFIGSQKVELRNDGSWSDVRINGNAVRGLEANVTQSGNEIENIQFRLIPRDFSDDIAGFDEVREFEVGSEISDPLFGTFAVQFEGPSAEMKDENAKSHVEVTTTTDEARITFTNHAGDSLTFTPYERDSNNELVMGEGNTNETSSAEGYVGEVDDSFELVEGQIFILNEGRENENRITKVYEVNGFVQDTASSPWAVELRDLASGAVREYRNGDQIGNAFTDADAEVEVAGLPSSSGTATSFNVSSKTSNRIYVQGGKQYLTLGNVEEGDTTVAVTLNETDRNAADNSAFSFNVSVAGNNNDELEVDGIDYISAEVATASEDDADIDTYLTEFGTFVEHDSDDQQSIDLWVPRTEENEVSFNVFVAPVGATATTVGADGTAQQVVPFGVGIAAFDDDRDAATANTNLIVVGGPCANSVAAELMGNPENCLDGFEPGQAMIRLYDLDSGKVALLIAGTQARETQAASRAVANADSRLMGEEASLTVTSVNDYSIQ